MADLAIDLSEVDDKLIQLIRNVGGNGVNSDEIVSLLTKENVNMQVNGIPLILFYFKTTRHLDIGVLEAFVNNGGDLNVQDSRGKTPLHWLVEYNLNADSGHTIEQLVSLVELFISNGGNPCLVDNDHSNVLMMLMSIYDEDWCRLIRPLIVNPKYTRQLLDGTNRLGFSFMSLCIESGCLETVSLELKSIAQQLDTNKIDENGNNLLHNLFTMSPDKNQPTVDLTECSMINEHGNDELPGQLFKRYLEYLVESGANVSHKNNYGLVPLQVALLSYRRLRTCRPRELKSLIPSIEVLSEQVPWSTLIVRLILNNYHGAFVRFLEQLVNSGLDCSHEQTLPSVLNLKSSCDVRVFSILVKGGARATINCIQRVLRGVDYVNGHLSDKDYAARLVLCILLEDGLPNDLVILLNDAIPGLVKFLIRCYDDRQLGDVLPKLLDKGLVLKIEDILELAQCPYTGRQLLQHLSPECIAELNSECPNVFERHISQGKINGRWAFDVFVGAGINVTVDTVVKLFNSKDNIGPVYRLIALMTNEIKDELKETLPNAISHLIKLLGPKDGTEFNLNSSDQGDFVMLIELLVKLEFKVTIDNLVQLFDASTPVSTLLILVNAVDDQVKGQITNKMPEVIGKLVDNKRRGGYATIKICFELIGTLVSAGIKIKIGDITKGLLVHHDHVVSFPIPCLIKYLDISLKDDLKRQIPDLMVQVLGFLDFLTKTGCDDQSWLLDIIVLLLDKFGLDINYPNVAQETFLHVLIGLSAKFHFRDQELLSFLDNVLTRSELDLDKATIVFEVQGSIVSVLGGNGTIVRPIVLAMQLKQFKIVNKLIIAGANCDGLDLTMLKDDQIQSQNTARLLYITGHYVDIGDNGTLKEWIETLPIRSLQELAALVVRKNTSRTHLNGIVDKFVFPQTVLDYFNLAHVQLEPEAENNEKEDIDYDSDASEAEHLDFNVYGAAQ